MTQNKYNKTCLQPVSRPVERILVFFQKVLKRDHFQRVLRGTKITYMLRRCILGVDLGQLFGLVFRGGGTKIAELFLKTLFQDLCSTGNKK